MTVSNLPHPWVARVQHDLVKRLLWVARDCRDSARVPGSGELVATLFDDEGQPTDAMSLWKNLQGEAPSGLDLADFGKQVDACVSAARQNDLAGVLKLEAAFERLQASLVSFLNEGGSTGTPDRKVR